MKNGCSGKCEGCEFICYCIREFNGLTIRPMIIAMSSSLSITQ